MISAAAWSARAGRCRCPRSRRAWSRRFAEQPLEVHHAQVPAGRGGHRRPRHEHLRRHGGGSCGSRIRASASATVGVRGEYHRLGGHHAAGGAGGRPAGPHRAASSGSIRSSSTSWSGRAARPAGRRRRPGPSPPARRRPAPVERGDDLDLVVLGQLLQDVGEPLVVQRGGHLDAASGVSPAARWPGRPGASCPACEQARGALHGVGEAQARHGVPLDDERLAAARKPEPALRTKIRLTDQSRVRSCWMPTSWTVTCSPLSRSVTRLHSCSPAAAARPTAPPRARARRRRATASPTSPPTRSWRSPPQPRRRSRRSTSRARAPAAARRWRSTCSSRRARAATTAPSRSAPTSCRSCPTAPRSTSRATRTSGPTRRAPGRDRDRRPLAERLRSRNQSSASLAQFADFDTAVGQFIKPDGAITKGEQKDITGQPAIALKSTNGSLWVATTGEPLPLQISDGKPGEEGCSPSPTGARPST